MKQETKEGTTSSTTEPSHPTITIPTKVQEEQQSETGIVYQGNHPEIAIVARYFNRGEAVFVPVDLATDLCARQGKGFRTATVAEIAKANESK